MKIWMRESWRWLRLRMVGPFQRMGQKTKRAAQRFIIKTVEKHGVSHAGNGSIASGLSSGVLLSLLSARREKEQDTMPSFQAVAVKDLLLICHPHADFFYHRPQDLAVTPWILRGDFETNVSAWISSNIERADRVLMIGGGQGYHALTVGKKVKSSGHLFILSVSPEDQSAIELNMRTNRLDVSLKCALRGTEESKNFTQTVAELVQAFCPTKILIESNGLAGLDLSSVDAICAESVFVIEHGEVSHFRSGSTAERFALSKKAA